MPQLMPLYWLISSVIFVLLVLMFMWLYSFVLNINVKCEDMIVVEEYKWWW